MGNTVEKTGGTSQCASLANAELLGACNNAVQACDVLQNRGASEYKYMLPSGKSIGYRTSDACKQMAPLIVKTFGSGVRVEVLETAPEAPAQTQKPQPSLFENVHIKAMVMNKSEVRQTGKNTIAKAIVVLGRDYDIYIACETTIKGNENSPSSISLDVGSCYSLNRSGQKKIEDVSPEDKGKVKELTKELALKISKTMAVDMQKFAEALVQFQISDNPRGLFNGYTFKVSGCSEDISQSGRNMDYFVPGACPNLHVDAIKIGDRSASFMFGWTLAYESPAITKAFNMRNDPNIMDLVGIVDEGVYSVGIDNLDTKVSVKR